MVNLITFKFTTMKTYTSLCHNANNKLYHTKYKPLLLKYGSITNVCALQNWHELEEWINNGDYSKYIVRNRIKVLCAKLDKALHN